MKFLLVFFAAVLGAATASAQSAPPKDAIGHERLVKAYVHMKNALALAKGGAAQPGRAQAKEAKAMDNGTLRKDIKIMADGVAMAAPKTPKLALVDAATHVHLARLALTTDRKVSYDDARARVAEHMAELKKADKNPTPLDAFQKNLRVIHEALKAI